VLLVDALECGEAPGAIRLLEPRDLTGDAPSTHGPSPMVFLEMLTRVHPCRPLLLGIQPGCLDPDAALSAPVRAAVVRIAGELERLGAE
jgi:hydrogenase maturation protease